MQRHGGAGSETSIVPMVVVLILAGVGTSVVAWVMALPLKGGPGLRQNELPMEFVFLTLSLMLLYAADLTGYWILWKKGWSDQRVRRFRAVTISVIAVYGAASASVFALATGSAWAWTAVLPVGMMGAILRVEITARRERSSRVAEGGSETGSP